MSHQSFRSGFVALVGRANVGKSTLLNQIVGQKVTIVSDKPQTTRNRIQGVWTTERAQVVFLDTPGFHRPQDRLGEAMMDAAEAALSEVDVVLFLVDGPAGPGRGDRIVADRLRRVETPVILVVNKLDAVEEVDRRRVVDAFAHLGPFASTHGISALSGEGTESLCEAILMHLSPGPKYYPDDWVSDHPERFVVAELVREKVLQLTFDEIPHATAVEVERMERDENRDLVEIEATIYVERESQKGIVIGKGGDRLKEVGTLARGEIERLLGTSVYLRLWVKVRRDWRDRENALRALGYK